MKWIPANEHLTKEWNSRTIARFIHTKLVIHELKHFLEKYPDRINTVEILDESPSPVEVALPPEDILQNRGLINGMAVEAYTERVVAAMEEYANQFRANHLGEDREGQDEAAWREMFNELPRICLTAPNEIHERENYIMQKLKQSFHLVKKNP